MNSNKSSPSGANRDAPLRRAEDPEAAGGALGACVIDERGAEVPITEQDIRQSLDSLHQAWEQEHERRNTVLTD